MRAIESRWVHTAVGFEQREVRALRRTLRSENGRFVTPGPSPFAPPQDNGGADA